MRCATRSELVLPPARPSDMSLDYCNIAIVAGSHGCDRHHGARYVSPRQGRRFMTGNGVHARLSLPEPSVNGKPPQHEHRHCG